MDQSFTDIVIEEIKKIPKGRVSTYGIIAANAGNKRGAQEVAKILDTFTSKHDLPWQRVINTHGEIAIKQPDYAAKQKRMLEKEGIIFKENKVDLKKYGFNPKQSSLEGFF